MPIQFLDADDFTEMIGVLQVHKEEAMRNLDMEQANNIQSEINELQQQIELEQEYVLKKRLEKEKVDWEKVVSGILKKPSYGGALATETITVETVESRDDEGEE